MDRWRKLVSGGVVFTLQYQPSARSFVFQITVLSDSNYFISCVFSLVLYGITYASKGEAS